MIASAIAGVEAEIGEGDPRPQRTQVSGSLANTIG